MTAGSRRSVLIVDHDAQLRWSLGAAIRQRYQVYEAAGEIAAFELAAHARIEVVLLDHGLPDLNGLIVLERLRRLYPHVPVIMLTSYASVEHAVQALRAGACNYLAKPFELGQVLAAIEDALESTLPATPAPTGPRAPGSSDEPDPPEFEALVGASPTMRRAKQMLRKIAVSPASTVLITGESGTGKDLAAHAIHCLSDRSSQPFVNITCSALPGTLLESELFGHERGAFTDAKARKLGLLELASGGTVFLDEIGEMAPGMQAKLLRFLEERAFRRVGGNTDIRPNVRVIAATHRDLQEAIRQGAFRADLYYRLAVLQVSLPPLRKREGDLERITAHLLRRFNAEFGRSVERLSPRGREKLASHRWPGNVRELRNTLERAVLLSEGSVLRADDLDLAVTRPQGSSVVLPPGGLVFHEVERELVAQALEQARGNQTHAAKLLGLTRDQIRYRVAKFDLGQLVG